MGAAGSFPRFGRATESSTLTISTQLACELDETLKILERSSGGPWQGELKIDDIITRFETTSVNEQITRDVIAQISHSSNSSLTLTAKHDNRVVEAIQVPSSTIEEPSVETAFLETIKSQVDKGFRRRDDEYIQSVFARHAELQGTTFHIPKVNLLMALKEFDISTEQTILDGENVESLFASLDRNSDGILDFDEFRSAIQAPSQLEDWARSVPMNQLLVDCLPRRPGGNALRAASHLTSDEIAVVCEGFVYGLKRVLGDHVQKLKETFATMDGCESNPSALKFETDAPKMRCGIIDDFHKGLSARIGSPHLDFETAMEIEHCHRNGFDIEFETTNHRIRTCSLKEWRIVLGVEQCPADQMKNMRRIPKIEELCELEIAKEARLTKPEVIAVVLYSGPMYFVYNSILRQYPEDVFQKFKDVNNFYPTTIFVLTSALQKLSRVTKVSAGMRLYRGLKGTVDLPELFFKCDQHGCTGFTEWGFMSTSSSIDVALEYSGVRQGGRLPRVLVIHVGSVDRGACITEFSQYQEESEYLYVPCSFLEGSGPSSVEITPSGVVEMIPVKVNSNIKAKTVDELVEQKKDMHVAAFSHHIEQIDRELHEVATRREANGRLSRDKSADKQNTVPGFLARIVAQCKDVLSRHKAVSRLDYVNDRVFRSLVLEMIDVKAMARAKLDEWLDNPSGSFIRLRWNAPLRTVHRRWIAYLGDQVAMSSGSEKKAASVQLCKALGLFAESVDEKNDLDETRLMCAAAEGTSEDRLRLLVAAGASVNQSRPDGVTPIWLAAENGHVTSIRALANLKADVKQAANDGTTPISIAARNGKQECILALASLGASVSQADKRGSYPVHQAALFGHQQALHALVELGADINKQDRNGFSPWDLAVDSGHVECAQYIEKSFPAFSPRPLAEGNNASDGHKTLIISTGDISDVDGFFALAEYAKTGSDVIFVMNYPAYIGVGPPDVDMDYADKNPGLGYKYSAKEVLARAPTPFPEGYTEFLARYQTDDNNERMKGAMTDLAFAMAHGVWNEVAGHGKLLFCVGGINSINPFSDSAIKNEVLEYADVLPKSAPKLSTLQGMIYGADGNACEVQWREYSNVYIDFNGSLAYWSGFLANSLSQELIVSKIKGVFVMGGVYAEQQPVTMPSIPKVLNRFSSATMNQLYHPQNAANFFAFLAQFGIPAYTITNNVVGDLTTYTDAGKTTKSLEGVNAFLDSNDLRGQFLRQLARTHYESRYNPPRKPYDYYVAFALTRVAYQQSLARMQSAGAQQMSQYFHAMRQDDLAAAAKCCLGSVTRTLFYSNVYGITFVSRSASWEDARAAYTAAVDTQAHANDPIDVKTKKEYFRKEVELMRSIDYLSSMPVRDVALHMDSVTRRLAVTVRDDEPELGSLPRHPTHASFIERQ